MPKDGWDDSLAYIGPYEQEGDHQTRCEVSTEFWGIICEALSHGDIPDGYPFNWEGSQELKDGKQD